ncbi:MAG: transglycosylase SLT domain-containing protein [Nanoarchaeota archaeon]
MPKRGIKRSKGSEHKGLILLKTIIGLIIGAAVLVILFTFFLNLYSVFFPSEDGRITKACFRELTEKILTLNEISDEEKSELCFVEDGWLVKGFDKGKSLGSCLDEACLCVCKDDLLGDNCEDKGFCKIMPKNVREKVVDKEEQVRIESGFYEFYISENENLILSVEKLEKKYESVKAAEVEVKSRSELEVLNALNYAKENSLGNRKCNCGTECDSYAKWITQYSVQYEIPDPLLIVALMMQESSCNKDADSGSSCGLMQVNYKIKGRESFIPLCFIPEENIKKGVEILKNNYDLHKNGIIFKCVGRTVTYTGWKAALRGYNGLGCSPNQAYFVEEVMARYEKLSQNV